MRRRSLRTCRLPKSSNRVLLAGLHAKLCLQDSEAASVTHSRDEVGAGQIRPHRRSDDRVFDLQHLAEGGFHVLDMLDFFVKILLSLQHIKPMVRSRAIISMALGDASDRFRKIA